MEPILKVIAAFAGLFLIVDGVYTVSTPPLGDEPFGYSIIAAGIVIPLLVFSYGSKKR